MMPCISEGLAIFKKCMLIILLVLYFVPLMCICDDCSQGCSQLTSFESDCIDKKIFTDSFCYSQIINLTRKNCPECSEAWLYRANIERELEYPQDIESNYSYARYGWLIKNRPEANENISRFLEKVYKDQNNFLIFKGYLPIAWEIKSKLCTDIEENFSYAYSTYYNSKVNNSSKLEFISSNVKDMNFRDAWYLLAKVHEDNNLSDEANKFFERALLSNESIFERINTFDMSYCSDRLGNYYIESDDRNITSLGYYYLAISELESDSNKSLKYLDKSLEEKISNIDAWNLRKKIYEQSAHSQLNRDKANYCSAYIKFLQNDLSAADSYLNKANMDRYIDTWILKGDISEKRISNKDTYANYQKAVERTDILFGSSINNLSSIAYAKLGIMEIKFNKNYDKSLDYFFKSLINDSSKSSNWKEIGNALFYLGHLEEAQIIFSYFLRSSPENETAGQYWNQRGEILASRSWFNSSLACFNNATNISQAFRRAWYNKGLAKINLKDYEGAVRDLDNATAAISGNETFDRDLMAKAWMNRAIANSKMGQVEESLIDLGNALMLEPSNDTLIDIYYAKGLVLLEIGKTDEAAQSFSTSMSYYLSGNFSKCCQNDKEAKIWHGMGSAYSRAGNNQKALQCFINCTESDRYDESAWIDRGRSEKSVGMVAESLISFSNAKDAINHSKAVIWCDLGYAWHKLTEDRIRGQNDFDYKSLGVNSSLDCFNRSIDLDEIYIPAYYNKSEVLLNSKPSEADNMIIVASRLNPPVSYDPQFKLLKGKIHHAQGDNESAFNYFLESYNSSESSKFNLELLVSLKKFDDYSNRINNSPLNDAEKIDLKEILHSLNNTSRLNLNEGAGPEIGDLIFISNSLDPLAKQEYELALCIADAEYKANLTDRAIQSYISAYKMGTLDESDQTSVRYLFISELAMFLIGIFYISSIIYHRAVRKANVGFGLILSNLIGFITIGYLLSNAFDPSRAVWSLILQLVILICLFLIINFILNLMDKKMWIMVEITLENLLSKSYGIIFLIASIILSLFIFLFIEIDSISSRYPIDSMWVRVFMMVISAVLILFTAMPLALALSYEKLDYRLRNIFACIQFTYLSMASVPLIWVFWSLGMPIGSLEKISIEEKTFSVPAYSTFLIILFFAFFIYPYLKGYNNYNKWFKNGLKLQDTLLHEARNLSAENLEKNYSELVNELGSIFGSIAGMDPDSCFKKLYKKLRGTFKSQSTTSDVGKGANYAMTINDRSAKEKYNSIKNTLVKADFWDRNDPRIGLIDNSENILVLAEKYITRVTAQSPVPRITGQSAAKKLGLEDPLAGPKKKISDLQSMMVSRSTLWTGYVTVVMSPLITIAVGWIISAIKIPLDQGSLAQLLSNAASTPVPGI